MSTTQVLCGALFAVGLFEGGKGLNWRIALKVGSTSLIYSIAWRRV